MKFQDDISNMNTYIRTYIHTYIRTSRNQYVPHFFKVGGIITTACNVGQAKKGHGACLKSGQLVYARFHTHSHRCCGEMYFNSRLDLNLDKVSGARNQGQGHQVKVPA